MKLLKTLGRLLGEILVPLVSISASVALIRWGVVPLLERSLSLDAPSASALRRIGVTLTLLATYCAVARYYERRKVTELSFRPLAIGIGASTGVALIGVTILSLFAVNYYQLVAFRGYRAALPIIFAILFAVVFEEVIFRGVIFRIMELRAGTIGALTAQALIFGGLHLFNEGSSAMTLISVTLLGAFWATIYVCSRNLWVPVANHFGWNLTIFLSGVPLSGQEEWRLSAPFESRYEGPIWLTGGGFGPEDSIINIVVMTCAVPALLYWTWRQGRFIRGSSGGARSE